jgi:hypothetical protein
MSKQCKPNTITIDGTEYTRVEINGDRHILVLDNGFIFVGNVYESDGWIHVSRAHNIRRWEKGGFGGMTLGAKSSGAVLDETAPFKVPSRVEIFRVPISESWYTD